MVIKRKKKRGKRWIQNANLATGSFTRKAAKRHQTPAEFQRTVLTNPGNYDTKTVKQANLRKTFVKMA
jgi:hypothetical protein